MRSLHHGHEPHASLQQQENGERPRKPLLARRIASRLNVGEKDNEQHQVAKEVRAPKVGGFLLRCRRLEPAPVV